MIAPVSVVSSLIADCKGLRSPEAFTLFRIMNIAHSAIWVYRKQTVYRNKKNWVYLAAGNLLSYAVGEGKLKFFLQVITLLVRVQRVMKRIVILQQSIKDLINAIKGKYPIRHFSDWTKPDRKPVRLIQISQALASTFACISHLTVECLAAYDTFYMRETDEILLDGKKSLEYLTEHRNAILQMIISQRGMIEKVVEQLKLPLNADEIITGAKKTLEGLHCLDNGLNKISLAVANYF